MHTLTQTHASLTRTHFARHVMAAAPLCSDTCERQTKGEREAKQKALKMQKKRRSRNPVKYLKCSGHRKGEGVWPHGALPIKLRAKSKRRLWKGLENCKATIAFCFFFFYSAFCFIVFVWLQMSGAGQHTHKHTHTHGQQTLSDCAYNT